jgi:putative PIN family toxin of toxin-antitoxin system
MLPTEYVTRIASGPAQQGGSRADDLPPSRDTEPVRVVLDTNTILDWLVFRDVSAAVVGAAIRDGRLQWLASPRMLAELQAVLRRPLGQRWHLAREHALTIDVTALAQVCPEPAIASDRLLCRDPDDQVFIDLARVHSPAVLLTRDRALRALRRRATAFGVVIATAADWAATIGPQ